MKIVAKPLEVKPVVSETILKKTALGKKTLAVIKEGVSKGYFVNKTTSLFLKQMSTYLEEGTCRGEALSIMAKHRTLKPKKEKELLQSVHKTDAIALHILNRLDVIAFRTRLTANPKKVFAKVKEGYTKAIQQNKAQIKAYELKKDAAKRRTERKALTKKIHFLKVQTKEMSKFYKNREKPSLKQALISPGFAVKKLPKNSEKELLSFNKKISTLIDQHLKGSGRLEEKQSLRFLAKDVNLVEKELKKQLTRGDNRIIEFRCSSKKSGHAITLFSKPHINVYDSQVGMMRAKNSKDFFNEFRKTYLQKRPECLGKKAVEFSMIIHKQR